jgi:hypothetical protein
MATGNAHRVRSSSADEIEVKLTSMFISIQDLSLATVVVEMYFGELAMDAREILQS